MLAKTPLGVPWIDPVDVAPLVVFLASDAARMVSGTSFAAGEVSGLLAVMDQAQVESDNHAPALRLVRLPGGGIDACASLLHAAESSQSRATLAPGCRAVLATSGAPPGRSP